MTLPWLDGTPAPAYKDLTIEELVVEWQQHRNDVVGQMCADEVMRRLAAGEYR